MTDNTTDLFIAEGVAIPRAEISVATSRSSGPGGQHVNKVETRVSLLFDLERSSALTAEQKLLIAERLGGRINREGVMRVSAQRERSQSANRRLAEERFVELLREALAEDEPRRPTRTPKRAKRRRLDEKRRQSETKRLRRPPPTDD